MGYLMMNKAQLIGSVVIITILIMMGGYIKHLHSKAKEHRDAYEELIETSALEKATYNSNIAQCNQSVKDQNDAIDLMNADLKLKNSQIKQFIEDSKATEQQHRDVIQKLKDELIPQSYEEAIQYLIIKLKEMGL